MVLLIDWVRFSFNQPLIAQFVHRILLFFFPELIYSIDYCYLLYCIDFLLSDCVFLEIVYVYNYINLLRALLVDVCMHAKIDEHSLLFDILFGNSTSYFSCDSPHRLISQ